MTSVKNYIQKAKDWVKSILADDSKSLNLDDNDARDFESVASGEYEVWRKKQIRLFDQEKTWESIEKQINPAKEKSKVIRMLRYWPSVAAVLVIAILGAGGYWIFKDMQSIEQQIVMPGKSIAYLEIDKNKRIELTSKDTLLLFDESKAQLDSGKIVYSSAEAKKEKNEYHKINVPRNGEFYVELSDGTKVWVNSESSVGFYSKFNGKTRVVDLVGEAYFEVAKNPDQPFIVKTSNMDVRVLGTHFNVKAYADEDYTYATLNEGKIRVSKGELNELLDTDQQLALNNSTKEFSKYEVDASIYSAWVKGKFVFKDERLDDILNALGRWYDVKIFYQDQNLQDDRFSLSVNRYDDIEILLNHLRLIGGVDFEVNKGVLLVK